MSWRLLRKHRLTVAIALGWAFAASAVVAPSAFGANTDAAGTETFVHPTAFTYCTTGATAGTPTENYAIIHRNRDSTVSSDVELKDASPNATYTVFFVQTPIFNHANCFTSVGTIQTNSQGNGRAHFSEALLSGQTGAFVNMFGPDGFQATPNYVFGDK